jgi:hypothetical protein
LESTGESGDDPAAEFLRLVVAAQDRGSTATKYILVASRLKIGDDSSWKELKKIADISRERQFRAQPRERGNGSRQLASRN